MRTVTITVDLPDEVAAHVKDIETVDRPFLSRLVLGAVTRHTVYEHLDILQAERRRHAKVLEEATSRERAVLRENPAGSSTPTCSKGVSLHEHHSIHREHGCDVA